MAHAAVYVAAAVVIGVAALIGFLTATGEKPQATHYGRSGSGRSSRCRPPSPPPSPVLKRSPPRRRRRSPQRRSNSPAVTTRQSETCTNCSESLYITVQPCNHKSLCRGCFEDRLENNATCRDCKGRIDSLSPSIPPYGKCKSCKRFTKLFKFLDCDHSLSLCIKCYEDQKLSFKNCPECNERIQGSEPRYATSGICRVCDEFTRFARFQPCGHGAFCSRHASQYLESSEHECSECGRRVTGIV